MSFNSLPIFSIWSCTLAIIFVAFFPPALTNFKYSCDQKLSVFSVLKTFLIPSIALPVDNPISFVIPSKSYCWALTRAVSKSFAKLGNTKAGLYVVLTFESHLFNLPNILMNVPLVCGSECNFNDLAIDEL